MVQFVQIETLHIAISSIIFYCKNETVQLFESDIEKGRRKMLKLKVLHLLKTFIIIFLIGVFAGQSLTILADQNDNTSKNNLFENSNSTNDYTAYLSYYSGAAEPVCEIETNLKSLFGNAVTKESYQGKKNVIIFGENQASVDFEFDVESEGLYTILLEYMAMEGLKTQKTQISIKLNDEYVYDYLREIELERPWSNKGEVFTDSRGNETRAEQAEVYCWAEKLLYDSEGRCNQPLKVYLRKGENKISITSDNGFFALSKLILVNKEKLKMYSEVKKEHKKMGYKESSNTLQFIEAEKYYLKSDSTILPDYDKSDAETSPASASRMLLNIIPASKYQDPGQWITWKTDIKESGLYKISLRARQKEKSGFASSRRLLIDGEIPFVECENLEFSSSSEWYIQTLSNGEEEFLFYLDKGTHEITLQVTSGSFANISVSVDEYIYRLNSVYRKVIMAMGSTNNDMYRDYKISSIPGVVEEITDLGKALKGIEEEIIKINGGSGSSLTSVRALINQLEIFKRTPDKLATMSSSFKSNIEALSTWNLSTRQQPLDLDYLLITSGDSEMPEATAGFFKNILFDIKRLIATFASDYGTIGDVSGEKAIKVWIATLGRDQLQILKELTDNKFVKETNIKVDISLVSTGINEAVLAGQAPDAALFLTGDQPVNLAMRGALVDLSNFAEFNEVTKRFYAGSMKTFEYKDGCYGIPLTETFNVMFVRNDIFSELKLSIPETWEDIYKVAAILQRNSMEIGIPSTVGMYATFLIQNGGSFYNAEMSKTGFDSIAAKKAFNMWTDFFTKYGFPIQYDFYNRFRSGEMPIAIAPFTFLTQFEEAAPEINNQWSIYTVPGTYSEDGNFNKAISISDATGNTTNPGLTQSITAACIFNSSNNKENAWRFIEWFSRDEIQSEFGTVQESVLGAISRYASANVNAFASLPWDSNERKVIEEQRSYITVFNEIPGSYYISRNINNAFRSVVNDKSNPAEMLNKYNIQINNELKHKSEEFNR